MRIDRRKTLAFAAATLIAPVAAQPTAPLLPQALRRGFNLPDQVPLRADLPAAETKTLKSLRKSGMTHIRLPVVAEAVLPQYSAPATLSAGLDDLTRAIERLVGLDYHVSVDLHPGPEFQGVLRNDPERAKAALIDGWPSLARRLSSWPATALSAELLNEPTTTDEIWRPFVEQLAKAVRAEMPLHTIIVGPAPFQRLDALTQWSPFPDERIVYACHYYDPMMFTHQGASWEIGSPWATVGGVPFPTKAADPALTRIAKGQGDSACARELRQMGSRAWNKDRILAQFKSAAEWSAASRAPIIINEFGVLKWKAPRAARLAWLAAVREAAETCGFGWAHWDYSTSFGLLDDSGAIDQGVMGALIPI